MKIIDFLFQSIMYQMLKKDFNVLIDVSSLFFDLPIKNQEETSKNNDYSTGDLLDNEYFPNNYKLIAIDLSKIIELENPDLKQEINLLVSLKMKQQCFSPSKNQKKQLLNFYKILWISYKMETQNIINLLNDSTIEESKFVTENGIL